MSRKIKSWVIYLLIDIMIKAFDLCKKCWILNEIIHFITKRRDRGRATERSNGLLMKPEDGATEQADDIE